MIFRDEAYKLAAIAAVLIGGGKDDDGNDPSWEEAASWAVELVAACDDALGRNEGEET